MSNQKKPYDVRKIIHAIRNPRRDLVIISAHRGLRFKGVPENSKESIQKAAEEGMMCIEVDVRMTRDGVPVIIHDKGLGRVTNVAEHHGRTDVYSPFTGKGYSPKVHETDWVGDIEHLKLKDEHGRICDEGVLTFEAMLDYVKEAGIDIVIFMDFKDKAPIPHSYEKLKTRTNARGVPACDWCVWKLDCRWYPTAAELEAAPWFQDAMENAPPLFIPVYNPTDSQSIDCEPRIGQVFRWSTVYDFPGEQYSFASGTLSTGKSSEASVTGDQSLLPGESPDGHDHRDDMELYRSLGFTWCIADGGPGIVNDLKAAGLREGVSQLLIDGAES